jgi:predicted ATPase
MLTHLKVTGFKNLVDVDVRFGPFTCIAGANGIGKSNLFDAIRFLSALADRPFLEAAKSVRDEGGRTGDIRSLFHRIGNEFDRDMSFEAEMIVPSAGTDDLGQRAEANITFLRYLLHLGYRDEQGHDAGALELKHEELVHINIGEAMKHLPFGPSVVWRRSVIHGRRTTPYLSTDNGPPRFIHLHQDGTGGRPVRRPAASLPRTVLSTVHAAENPTALLARREMQSWRLLQLEPAALRKPDEFDAPPRLGSDGAHLPATLYRLARQEQRHQGNGTSAEDGGAVYARVANRLAELINDVQKVEIDRDEKRELLTLQVTDQDNTSHPAQALSDGTLRFLALAVLELDPEAQGLLCLEEPENGIHPERIPAMLRLLKDIATDTQEPVGPDNPLRQVIVNTHSPAVVMQVCDDDLLVAELRETVRSEQRFKRVCFSCLSDTWRARAPEPSPEVSKGKLLAYLNPVPSLEEDIAWRPEAPRNGRSRRVKEREDMRNMFADLPDENQR